MKRKKKVLGANVFQDFTTFYINPSKVARQQNRMNKQTTNIQWEQRIELHRYQHFFKDLKLQNVLQVRWGDDFRNMNGKQWRHHLAYNIKMQLLK